MQDTFLTIIAFLAVAIGIPLFGVLCSALIETARSSTLRTKLVLQNVHPGLIAVGFGLYGAIALLLFGGLLMLIAGTVALPFDETKDPSELRSEYLFYVLRVAGLTTVLGAVIALPFTLIRLGLSQKQTKTAEEGLFNEKINAATLGLYARREVSIGEGAEKYDVWQDDIVQRCAAIDRLEGLADENKSEIPRIARLLSVYVRELSAEVPAKSPPDEASSDQLQIWTLELPKPRSDMEIATQTLGRLGMIKSVRMNGDKIDLRNANLQRHSLKGADFKNALLKNTKMQKANLIDANFRDADLSRAQMQHAILEYAQMQEVKLNQANLQNANLSGANLKSASLITIQLQGANLSYAKLHRANLMGVAQLQKVDLTRAKMSRANLSGARMEGATLLGTELQEANLAGTHLQGADFFAAQLQGANLTGANFDNGTSFSEATLQAAAVKSVDLSVLSLYLSEILVMFGDASVTLPNGVTPDHPDWPQHWPKRDLERKDFYAKWRAWQKTLPEGWDKDILKD